jgi:hypothetical protein
MDDETRMKALKLLADPMKLKVKKQSNDIYDKFKSDIETKFNCKITNHAYVSIVDDIKVKIQVMESLDRIINLVD